MGLLEGVLLFKYKAEIFDYNSELGFNTIAQKTNKGSIFYYTKDKRKAHSSSPIVTKAWRLLSIMIGTAIGWILLWFLLEQRLNYLSNPNIYWEDFALFLLSYIGISGRLNTIPESVQQWFKR